jgi:hemoglobin
MNKLDITELADIQVLVDAFYGKVRKDELLKGIFEDVIQDRWLEHLEKMYRFWQTVLLDEHTYQGSPFVPHAHLPVEKAHFERWIQLFFETVDEKFSGEKAERAKWQGERMAEIFLFKINYYRTSTVAPIL